MRASLAAALMFTAAGFTTPTVAADWVIDPAASEIAFAGTNSGKPFKGTFGSWTGTIDFDPDLPEAGKVEINVDLSSAKTGDATYDKTLPQKDWLDTTASSKATFVTSTIRKGEGAGQYVAEGTLTIRGKAASVTLPFTLKIEGERAQMSGRAQLRRLDYGIGQGSDAKGAWVSIDIPVDVKVSAVKK